MCAFSNVEAFLYFPLDLHRIYLLKMVFQNVSSSLGSRHYVIEHHQTFKSLQK